MNKPNKKEHHYFVYIMTNKNKSTLYIGVTNNLVFRCIKHISGTGSKFTKKYKLKNLVHYEIFQYINDAIAREKELKGWSRAKKVELIRKNNHYFNDLEKKLFKECGITKKDIKEINE